MTGNSTAAAGPMLDRLNSCLLSRQTQRAASLLFVTAMHGHDADTKPDLLHVHVPAVWPWRPHAITYYPAWASWPTFFVVHKKSYARYSASDPRAVDHTEHSTCTYVWLLCIYRTYCRTWKSTFVPTWCLRWRVFEYQIWPGWLLKSQDWTKTTIKPQCGFRNSSHVHDIVVVQVMYGFDALQSRQLCVWQVESCSALVAAGFCGHGKPSPDICLCPHWVYPDKMNPTALMLEKRLRFRCRLKLRLRWGKLRDSLLSFTMI